jgi:hypothetical protein
VPRTFDETFGERWSRRLITGPALLAVAPAYLAALPVTLGATAATDLIRGRPWTATRLAAALGATLGLHAAGLAGMLGAWLAGRRAPDRERELEERLQIWLANATWRSLERLYSVELEVSGDDCLEAGGPILVLAGHASPIDAILPMLVLGRDHGWRVRHVMRRELLWDPCLDAIGHRWPTAFVRRDAGDPRAVENLAMLGDELTSRDAIVLPFEGPASAEGPLALLDVDRQLDVVLFAHTGLEGLSRFEDLLSERLLGCRIEAAFWRIGRTEIPDGDDARRAWLEREWERAARWSGEHRERHPGGGRLERVRLT